MSRAQCRPRCIPVAAKENSPLPLQELSKTMPKASENSALLSCQEAELEQIVDIPPLPQCGTGATGLQHEQIWRWSDAWAAVVGKALQLTMSTHQGNHHSVLHSFSPSLLAIAQGNETFLHTPLLQRGSLPSAQPHYLLRKRTGKD